MRPLIAGRETPPQVGRVVSPSNYLRSRETTQGSTESGEQEYVFVLNQGVVERVVSGGVDSARSAEDITLSESDRR